MKPILALLTSLVALAAIAANPWRMIRETPDPDAGQLWIIGDMTPHSSFTEEGIEEDGVTVKTMPYQLHTDGWWRVPEINQTSQSQSCVRPVFREDLIPGLPSEITSRYPSRAATLIGDQQTPAANIPHNLLLRGDGSWLLAAITSTPFTNVVSGDNHTGCSTCDGIAKNHWLIYHPWHDGGLPYVPPTERWTITTVGVRHTATIHGWPGELVKEDITSCTTNREVWKADWVKVEPIKIQVISGGGGGSGFANGTVTNLISKSITNTIYYEPIISDGTPPQKFRPLYSQAPTNGPNLTIWQYDSNRKWNSDIEDAKRIEETSGQAFVRGDGRVPFDFKTNAGDIELGYKPDGTVTWRKTPERNKP